MATLLSLGFLICCLGATELIPQSLPTGQSSVLTNEQYLAGMPAGIPHPSPPGLVHVNEAVNILEANTTELNIQHDLL